MLWYGSLYTNACRKSTQTTLIFSFLTVELDARDTQGAHSYHLNSTNKHSVQLQGGENKEKSTLLHLIDFTLTYPDMMLKCSLTWCPQHVFRKNVHEHFVLSGLSTNRLAPFSPTWRQPLPPTRAVLTTASSKDVWFPREPSTVLKYHCYLQRLWATTEI